MSEQKPSSYYQPQPMTTPPWAIVSLISGIASYFIVPVIGSIVALISGYSAKKEIRESNGQVGGDGLATAGLVLGWINIALGLAAICLIILMVTGVISGIAICGPLTNWLQNSNY